MHPSQILPPGRIVRRCGSVAQSRRGAIKLRMIVVLVLVCGFVAAAVFATMSVDTEPVPSVLRKMKESFADGERLVSTEPKKALVKYIETERYGQRVLAKEPKSTEALLFVGQSLMRQNRDPEALPYFLQVQDSESDAAAWCHLAAGQILCNQYSQFRQGEEQFRRALELRPSEPNASKLLANVLKMGTRNWELIPLELTEIEQKEALHIQLMDDLSRNERLPPDMGLVLKGIKANPNDPIVLLGHANLLRAQLKFDEAEALLRKCIELAPTIDEAHVRLGWVLFESRDDAKFLKWHAAAKPSLVDHPLFWTVRGARAERAHEPQVAARCYWEAIKRDPNLQDANSQLGLLLTQMDRKAEGAPFLERAQKLADYIDLVRRNHFRAYELKKGDIELATQAIKAADALGDLWETYGWTQMTYQLDPSNKALEQAMKQVESVAKDVKKERTLPNYNPANKLDLSKLPLPKWSADSVVTVPKVPASRVSFEDQAQAAGIKFQYFGGSDPEVHAAQTR